MKKVRLTKSQKNIINLLKEKGNITFDELYSLTNAREEVRLKETLYQLLTRNVIEYKTVRPTSATLIFRLKEAHESI